MFVLFRLARALFLLQGLAFECVGLAGVVAVSALGAPPELQSAAVAGIAVGVLFGGSGFVIGTLMRRATNRSPATRLSGSTVTATLAGLSVCGLAAVVAGQGLPAVWSQVAGRLGDIGLAQAMGRGADPFAGMLVLPVVLALWVPVLVTVTALVSIGLPIALALSVALDGVGVRNRVTLTAHCQGTLALGAWIAQFAFSRLGELVDRSMVASGDAEVVALTREMTAAVGAFTRAATFLLVPALGMAVLATILAVAVTESAPAPSEPSPSEGETPGRSASAPAPKASESPRTSETLPQPAESPVTRQSTIDAGAGLGSVTRSAPRPSRPEVRPSAHAARAALAGLGALLLCFSACDSLRARPSFESAVPAPATSVATPPSTIEITFSDEIDPASGLYLTRLPAPGGTANVESPDAIAQPIAVTMAPARQGERHRTLRAVTRSLTPGLYHVAWTAQPARGGVGRRGSFSFGVGVAVPPDEGGVVHTLQEADSGARNRRLTLAGGILLLIIGFVLPRLSQPL